MHVQLVDVTFFTIAVLYSEGIMWCENNNFYLISSHNVLKPHRLGSEDSVTNSVSHVNAIGCENVLENCMCVDIDLHNSYIFPLT